MSSSINAIQGINPFVSGAGAAQAVNSASSEGNPFASGSSNSTSSSTLGLNGMQTGDSVYTSAQAGKSAGVSRILGYA